MFAQNTEVFNLMGLFCFVSVENASFPRGEENSYSWPGIVTVIGNAC